MVIVVLITCLVTLLLTTRILSVPLKTQISSNDSDIDGIQTSRKLYKKKVILSSEWASCMEDSCMIPATTLVRTNVTISVLTHGKSMALVSDLLKNLVHYTHPDTLIVVHHNPFDSRMNVTVRQLYQQYGNTSKLIFNPCSFNSQARYSFIFVGHMVNYKLLAKLGISTEYLLLFPHNARLFRKGVEDYIFNKNYSKPKVLGYKGQIWLKRASKDEKELQCLFGEPNTTEPINLNNTFGWQWHEGSFYPSDLLDEFLEWMDNKWPCIRDSPKSAEEWVLPSWVARNEAVRQRWGIGGRIAIHWNRGERNPDCIQVMSILKDRYGNSTTLPMKDKDVMALCRMSTQLETLLKAYEDDNPKYGCKRMGGHISEPALHFVDGEIPGNSTHRREVLNMRLREYLDYANSTERITELLSTHYKDVDLGQAHVCKCSTRESRKVTCSKSYKVEIVS